MLGKPLATVCYVYSMCITLLGACRTWRLQRAMLRGKTISGGFEIMSLALGFLAVSMCLGLPWSSFSHNDTPTDCVQLVVVFFGLLIALDVVKESSGG